MQPTYATQKTLSTMKFTSLTTIVISAAAMAGIAIASNSDTVTPLGRDCSEADGAITCASGPLKGYNNGNDYGFECAAGKIVITYPCSCVGCCKNSPHKGDFVTCSKGVNLWKILSYSCG
ncbi:uncharacterized protein EDB93DRAFT_557473 [Suillus bovinus]|uniref:uncharacterized protein n=1 Tax=Suillus bovinus TaxID=48563 RepID=UPI001B85DB57|nr:uncharacterized protein EDB93DRAFT_557473 [Suillus bovinus]KAG2158635.1 hypothetical protein EDB93DRAFT_557473 [Suillus bovinus]